MPVDLDVLVADGRPALVLATTATGQPAAAWLAEHRIAVHHAVSTYGAILVRGLGVVDAAGFAEAARELIGEPMIEREAFAPRDRHPGGVYSASKWPPEQPMCPHNELSYAMRFPGLMLFGCVTASEEGGATVLADTRHVLAELPADLVDRAEEVGWELHRNHHEDLGVTLADAFGGATRTDVQEYCRANAIDCDWGTDGQVRTRQRRPAITRHPVTGERCWFNQLAFLNGWTLDPDVREYLLVVYGPDSLPFDTRWGDGEPVGADVVEVINQAYQKVAVREPWRAGDLLLVDNVRMAHGRDPVRGPREVLVAMGAPIARSDLD
jgi:alpha-ketoglutarate-dependent taurine dioxygenase